MGRNCQKWCNGALILAVVATVFSVEVPVATDISIYASINTEDIAILVAFIVLLGYLMLYSDFMLSIRFPSLTAVITVISLWILITVLVALIRSPESLSATALWTMKWFEIVLFFIIVQTLINSKTSRNVGDTLTCAGILLAVVAVFKTVFGRGRVEAFFNNPNPLGGFFSLVTVICVAWILFGRSRSRHWTVLSTLGATVSVFAVLTTLSRSGILNLAVSLGVLFLLIVRRLSKDQLLTLGATAGIGAISFSFVFPAGSLNRLFDWYRIVNGRIIITGQSFRVRFALVKKGFELFIQQPIFGYGWFATPSRVGYLDIYLTTLLVDLGIVGFALVSLFHLMMFRKFLQLRRRGAHIYGTAGTAWNIGLLVQSIGGAFVRSPQMLIILFLLLGIAWSETKSDSGGWEIVRRFSSRHRQDDGLIGQYSGPNRGS